VNYFGQQHRRKLAGIRTEKVEMIRRVRSNTDKEVSKYEKRINGDTSANTEA